MIERVVLEDFQPHQLLDLKLDLVNVLVGLSDRGKTAVLRGLRWLCLNEPNGTAFIRHGADSARVAAKIDGRWVTRFRSADDNYYEFAKEVYRSLRSPTVPSTISDFLNLGEVNFQWQHDAPFWLTDPAGEVSRNLNRVINLQEIDDLLARAASGVSLARGAVRATETRLSEAQEKADSSAWAVAAELDLQKLTNLDQDRGRLQRDVAKLAELIQRAECTSQQLAIYEELADSGEAARLKFSEYLEVASNAAWLERSLLDAERINRQLADDMPGDWVRLQSAWAEGNQVAESRAILEALISDHDEAQRDLRQAEEFLADAEEKLAEAMKEGCPVCGAKSPSATPSRLQSSLVTSTGATDPPRPGGRIKLGGTSSRRT